MIEHLNEDIEYDVKWYLKELLNYVKKDVEITVSLSRDNGVEVIFPEDQQPIAHTQDYDKIKQSVIKHVKDTDNEEEISDKELIYLAKSSIGTLVVKKEITRSFFQNSINISKSQTPFIETFLGQRLNDLRGEYTKLILNNKIYFAHFSTSRDITGNACSLHIQWPKHSSLSSQLQELLQCQYDFYAQNKDAKCLPENLKTSYELYTISGTKAFKLVICKK